MTLRLPPWEAERIANALEYARMLTATEPRDEAVDERLRGEDQGGGQGGEGQTTKDVGQRKDANDGYSW